MIFKCIYTTKKIGDERDFHHIIITQRNTTIFKRNKSCKEKVKLWLFMFNQRGNSYDEKALFSAAWFL